jgi:hypothetical protein
VCTQSCCNSTWLLPVLAIYPFTYACCARLIFLTAAAAHHSHQLSCKLCSSLVSCGLHTAAHACMSGTRQSSISISVFSAWYDVRCDDRIEDFCRVVVHSNHLESLDNLKAAWGNVWACLKSDEG